MTKFFKSSSILLILLAVSSVYGKRSSSEERHGCRPQTDTICDLKVKNDVCVGGTLDAGALRVKCCNKKLPVLVTCEPCLRDLRGSFRTQTTILFFDSFSEVRQPLIIVNVEGCGFTVQGQAIITGENQAIWNAMGISVLHARTVELQFRVTFDNPCSGNPAVASTLQASTGGALVFDLEAAGFGAINTVVTEVNMKSPTQFDIVFNANIFGSTQVAVQTIINLLTASGNTGFDFISQCSLR